MFLRYCVTRSGIYFHRYLDGERAAGGAFYFFDFKTAQVRKLAATTARRTARSAGISQNKHSFGRVDRRGVQK